MFHPTLPQLCFEISRALGFGHPDHAQGPVSSSLPRSITALSRLTLLRAWCSFHPLKCSTPRILSFLQSGLEQSLGLSSLKGQGYLFCSHTPWPPGLGSRLSFKGWFIVPRLGPGIAVFIFIFFGCSTGFSLFEPFCEISPSFSLLVSRVPSAYYFLSNWYPN